MGPFDRQGKGKLPKLAMPRHMLAGVASNRCKTVTGMILWSAILDRNGFGFLIGDA